MSCPTRPVCKSRECDAEYDCVCSTPYRPILPGESLTAYGKNLERERGYNAPHTWQRADFNGNVPDPHVQLTRAQRGALRDAQTGNLVVTTNEWMLNQNPLDYTATSLKIRRPHATVDWRDPHRPQWPTIRALYRAGVVSLAPNAQRPWELTVVPWPNHPINKTGVHA